MSAPTLNTIAQHCAKHPEFTPGGERYKIFHASENGMADMCVIIRDGRRVLLHEQRYFLWLDIRSTGELARVRRLLRDARDRGEYLAPEEAVAQARGRSAVA